MSIPDRAEPIRDSPGRPNLDQRGLDQRGQDQRGEDRRIAAGFTSIYPGLRPAVDFGIYPGSAGVGTPLPAPMN